MSKASGYGQFCPVAMAAQVLTAKWTPLVVRELMTSGPMRFSELRRGVPKMSQSLLTKRLDELEHGGIITKKPLAAGGFEYGLTQAGEAVRPIIEMMGLWGHEFLMHQLVDEDYDPNLLFWDIRRTMDEEALATDRPFIVHFEVSDVVKAERRWWLIFDKAETDVCCKDPGRDINLKVSAPIKNLTDVWTGVKDLNAEIAAQKLRFEGTKKDQKLFLDWFVLSPFANAQTRKRLSIA
jgi:DNA-binding HxlR family transcriptional regulator